VSNSPDSVVGSGGSDVSARIVGVGPVPATGEVFIATPDGVVEFPASEAPHVAVMLAELCDGGADRAMVRDAWAGRS
jgi:hypothetical protein